MSLDLATTVQNLIILSGLGKIWAKSVKNNVSACQTMLDKSSSDPDEVAILVRCVKVSSIAKSIKAKQYSLKISKVWLIRSDIQYCYCIIKLDFLILEFRHAVLLVNLFMPRLTFLICF